MLYSQVLYYGIVAQLVEQGPFKAKVAGSSPANPTIFQKFSSLLTVLPLTESFFGSITQNF